eukprot:747046-Hanusia_phi.AAC.1
MPQSLSAAGMTPMMNRNRRTNQSFTSGAAWACFSRRVSLALDNLVKTGTKHSETVGPSSAALRRYDPIGSLSLRRPGRTAAAADSETTV